MNKAYKFALFTEAESGPTGPTLTLTFDTGTAPAYSLGDWNTYLGSAYTGLQTAGDVVTLSGDTGVTIPESGFGGWSLVSVVDTGTISVVELNAFNSCYSLTEATFQTAITIGRGCFYDCILLTAVDAPLCTTLGNTTGDDLVFSGISGNNISLRVAASLATCNSGNPDGDIQFLEANNTATIYYV